MLFVGVLDLRGREGGCETEKEHQSHRMGATQTDACVWEQSKNVNLGDSLPLYMDASQNDADADGGFNERQETMLVMEKM